ncbi:hypothetical protein KJ765_01680 [Candidatus Micrarchaeota archaeon]|nr:hypothetical protein [Candidatus Micrarchaeota archaeon]
MNQRIDDELDQRFREEVAKRYGWKKGNLKKALEEAINAWVGQKEKAMRK